MNLHWSNVAVVTLAHLIIGLNDATPLPTPAMNSQRTFQCDIHWDVRRVASIGGRRVQMDFSAFQMHNPGLPEETHRMKTSASSPCKLEIPFSLSHCLPYKNLSIDSQSLFRALA